MPIAFQTNTTATNSGATPAASQSLTIDKPTGLATGDVLVAIIWLNEDLQTPYTLPSDPTFPGFTKVSEKDVFNTSTSRRGWVYRKTITDGGSEPASYTFTVNYSSTGTGNLAGVLSRFSGVDTTTPIDTNSTLDGETTSITLTFNGVTTTTANTMLVMCGGSRRNVTTTYNDGTKIADAGIAGTTAAAGVVATMGYLAQVSAGASGNKTATISGGIARENDGLIVALKEAVASGLTITSVNTTNTAFSAQTNSAVIGTGLSASVVCTYAGIACTNESASSSTSLKITFPNFFTNNIKLGRNYEFKVVG